MKAPLFLLTLLLILLLNPISAVDFLFNGFDDSPSHLSLFGNATIESKVLTLTNQTSYSTGRALYNTTIRTKDPATSSVLPFSTSFIFAMAPSKNAVLSGHGLVFLFAPSTGINGTSSAQHLGLFNLTNNGDPTNHVFGVEFDVFANQEFKDIDANHVGIDLNSLESVFSNTSGFWSGDDERRPVFKPLKLNNGRNYQVWIDYKDSIVNVTIQIAGKIRPKTPLLSKPLNLSGVMEEEMFVGFTAATGRLVQSHKVLAWSFSNSNFSLSDGLITTGLPSFVIPKETILKKTWFVFVLALICLLVLSLVGFVTFVVVRRRMEIARKRALMEDWEMEYWPHRISYEEIESGTKGFDEKNVIGVGGNGKVYKGLLQGGAVEVAVKRISQESSDGMREFVAEISSLGRLKHRNLVSLRGWCKKEVGSFMLVYDYMENGSLDRWIFEEDEKKHVLSCDERIQILKGVASGILYLHEGWDSKVLHRDIKASNVLLDRDMIPRLSDFGLARVHGHEQAIRTTRVVGTAGYLAPEVVKTGRASTQTDVFAYGVLVLEVMCGRCKTKMEETTVEDLAELSEIENHNLGQMQTRRLRSASNIDNTPESFLAFDGNESVHGLYDLLLNYRSSLSFLLTADVPVLYSPVPFQNAAMSSPKIDCKEMVTAESTSCYMVETKGECLPPWIISNICAHVIANGQNFEASFVTEPNSVSLNMGLPQIPDKTEPESAATEGTGETNDVGSDIPGTVICPQLRSGHLKNLKYCNNSYTVSLSPS